MRDRMREFYPGYIKKMAVFLQRLEQDQQGSIYYCGDYLAGATTGSACASGRRAARRLIAQWGTE
jgi:oxygen-dependent protoporphyrinogen oxidase